MTSKDDKRVFDILRPHCVNLSKLALAPPELIKANSIQTLEALNNVYTQFNASVSPDTKLSTNLADYIFVPLSYLLKQPDLPDGQINFLLKIITLLVRHCWSEPNSFAFVLARQLFPLVTFLTGGSPNPEKDEKKVTKSNALKTSGSQTLNELFKALSIQKKEKVYDFFSNVETLPALGHCVTILLEFSLSSSSIDLQKESLTALDTLYFDLINDGEILSYILPGNVSTLTKCITSAESKTHYTIVIKALDILGRLLVLVYDDKELGTEYKDISKIEQISEVDFEFDQIQLKDVSFGKVHRTKSWLKATSAQVKLALVNIKKVNSHDKFEVRQKLAKFAKNILQHCIYSLNSSVPTIVEILAFLSRDERLNIDQKTVLKSGNPKHQEIINKVISSELNNYVESFTAVIQSSNEQKILSNINAIKFIFNQAYSNPFLIKKLINSSVIEISDLINKANMKKKKVTSTSSNVSDLMLITQDITTISLETKSLTVYDQYFNKDIQIKLSELFQALGELSNPEEIIDDLISNGASKSLVEKGVSLWISNCITQGYLNTLKPSKVVDEFLSFDQDADNELTFVSKSEPDFVYALIDFSKEILDEVSEIESSTDILEQVNSIALDTIGIVADYMRDDFRNELVDYLYPVIDSLASSSEVVRSHALNTSMIIADNLYSGSLYNLIHENSDYLVDSISFKLSNAITQRTTAILAVCVKVAGYEIIESFKDVMEIVFSLLDHYHGYDDICIGFFLLFEIIADEIKKKYMSDSEFGKLEFFEVESSYKPWGMTNIKQLVELLDKRNRDILLQEPEKELSLEDDVEAEIGNAEDSDDEDEETAALEKKEMEEMAEEEAKWISPVPKEAYMLLQQIVYYGERLLTHPSVKLHTQILRTYNKALPIFATSSKHLLPIAASIWPIISYYVNGSDPKVVLLAAQVMTKMITYTGSFISQRFIELWKKLRNNEFLVTASRQVSQSQKVVLPGINSKCYESLVEMLVQALNSLGRYIPDSVSVEIVTSCIGVVEVDKFKSHSDIALIIKQELFSNEQIDPPKGFKSGETFIDFPVSV